MPRRSDLDLDLEPWLEVLAAALPPSQSGALVRLARAGADDVELGVLPLDGLHPAELLDGLVAPDDWLAIGVVARGWAAPVGPARPSAHPARRRVCSTVLVDRLGAVVGRTVDERGVVVVDGPPADGLVLELLRAAFGK